MYYVARNYKGIYNISCTPQSREKKPPVLGGSCWTYKSYILMIADNFKSGKADKMDASLIQLQSLGYQAGDQVWIRCLAGKGFNIGESKLYPFDGYLSLASGSLSFTRLNPVSKGGGVKFTRQDGIEYLSEQNKKGYGIYLIPNKGGRKDDEITSCPSLFYECDGIPKSDQLDRISRLPLAPSLIIETRNSIHVYYRTKEDSPTDWRNYQKRLIQLMDSDPAIHNESRLMRLAGFDHQKAGADPYPIKILETNTNIYSRDQFDQLLPVLDDRWTEIKREKISPEQRKERLKTAQKHRETFFLSDGFPLEICISKESRYLIANGAPKGAGYYEGFKLACDLIGTAEWLTAAGYQYLGDTESLFREFAYRSPASYNGEKDIDLVLNHAGKNRPTPSLPPEAIENCIKAWQWNQTKRGFGYSPGVENIEKVFLKYEKELTKKEQSEIWINSFGKGIGSLFSKAVGKIINQAKKKPYIPSKTSQDNVISIAWGEYNKIPTPDQYQGEKIKLVMSGLNNTQKTLHRKNVVTLAARLGYKISLDTSHTGSGKSYLIGELNVFDFYLENEGEPTRKHKLIYTSQSPDNASTSEIQKFTRLPSRNRGYLSGDKLNPLGEPQIHRAPLGHDIPKENLLGHPNCLHADRFVTLRNHNQNSKGLCGTCPLLNDCQKGLGDDHGFLFEMFSTLANAQKIRSSIVGLSVDMVQNNILIHDEIGASYSPIIQVFISKDQLLSDLTEAISFSSEINQVTPAILKLASLTKPDPKHIKYGYDFKECLDVLGELPDNISSIIASVRAWEDKNNDELLTPDDNGNYPESKPKWLSTVLSVWSKSFKGAISVHNEKIVISIKNTHLIELTESSKFSHFCDATMTRERLALYLDTDINSIFHFEEEDPFIDNLTIQPINFGAKLNNDRSESLQQRVKIFRDSPFAENMPTIEFKKYSRPNDLIHGSDGRGSNSFEKANALLLLGIYRKNAGAVLSEYQCLTGETISLEDNDLDFIKYYEDTNFAELIQEVGRLRANRRQSENLIIYIADVEPLDGLKNYGYKINPIRGIEEFCLEAAERGTHLHGRILTAIKDLLQDCQSGSDAIEKARKITQKQIADMVKISIAQLKNISSLLEGGWRHWMEGIVSLIYSNNKAKLYPDGGNLSQSDQAWILATYIPMLQVEYLGREDEAFDEVKVLLDNGILDSDSISPEQIAWILFVLLRRMIGRQDLSILINLLAHEMGFA